ncbi:MAG: bacteriocin [Nostocaceae cyanobacterium]|nr:bacteriocin [Nostocaceae cyanobacterium]
MSTIKISDLKPIESNFEELSESSLDNIIGGDTSIKWLPYVKPDYNFDTGKWKIKEVGIKIKIYF